jgi:hypothetical protein
MLAFSDLIVILTGAIPPLCSRLMSFVTGVLAGGAEKGKGGRYVLAVLQVIRLQG